MVDIVEFYSRPEKEQLSLEIRYHWRKQIAKKTKGRLLNATDLLSVMKEPWEPSNENILFISFVEGEPEKGNPPEIQRLPEFEESVNSKVEGIFIPRAEESEIKAE